MVVVAVLLLLHHNGGRRSEPTESTQYTVPVLVVVVVVVVVVSLCFERRGERRRRRRRRRRSKKKKALLVVAAAVVLVVVLVVLVLVLHREQGISARAFAPDHLAAPPPPRLYLQASVRRKRLPHPDHETRSRLLLFHGHVERDLGHCMRHAQDAPRAPAWEAAATTVLWERGGG